MSMWMLKCFWLLSTSQPLIRCHICPACPLEQMKTYTLTDKLSLRYFSVHDSKGETAVAAIKFSSRQLRQACTSWTFFPLLTSVMNSTKQLNFSQVLFHHILTVSGCKGHQYLRGASYWGGWNGITSNGLFILQLRWISSVMGPDEVRRPDVHHSAGEESHTAKIKTARKIKIKGQESRQWPANGGW